MWVLYMKFSNRLKHIKMMPEINVIPRNMAFAVLRSSFLIHIRFSYYIYSRTFYKHSLVIMH